MLYCGIDITERQHILVVVDGEGRRVRPVFPFTSDGVDLELLLEALPPADEVLVGLSPGPSWLALYDLFSARGYCVTVVHPLVVEAHRRIDWRVQPEEKVDALSIAQALRFAHLAPGPEEAPTLLGLREITRFRFQLTGQIATLKRRLLGALGHLFSDAETRFSPAFHDLARKVLDPDTGALEVAEADLAELEGVVDDALGEAPAGVGLLADAAHHEVRALLAQVAYLAAQRAAVDALMTGLLSRMPQGLITTVPGIGPVLGATIIAEIGDPDRFASGKALVGYTGVGVPVREDTAVGRGRGHRPGAPYLHESLWRAAGAAILEDEELGDFYRRKREEGKSHNTTLVAISRKLLVRGYMVIKEQKPYVSDPVRRGAPEEDD